MTQIGSVYGEALYSLAREEGLDKLKLFGLFSFYPCVPAF